MKEKKTCWIYFKEIGGSIARDPFNLGFYHLLSLQDRVFVFVPHLCGCCLNLDEKKHIHTEKTSFIHIDSVEVYNLMHLKNQDVFIHLFLQCCADRP